MKLKPFVFPVLYLSLIFVLVGGLYITSKAIKDDTTDSLSDITYVSSIILGDVVPVVNVDATVNNPYVLESVKINSY